MKNLTEIREKYEVLLNQWAAEYGTVESMESMRRHYGKVGWLAALGWVLDKDHKDVAEDMDQELRFVHRENPSIVKSWERE